MLEQINRINLLHDIYAPLLTERQGEVLRLYYCENYTLAEIADFYHISRQAVHDLIRRAVAAIEELESKLGLYSQFSYREDLLMEAETLLQLDLQPAQLDRLKEIIAALQASNEN